METDGSTLKHYPTYGGVIENPGPATTLYLKVRGSAGPGVPLSGTSAQTVPLDAPTGASAFSFQGANPPYPYVCAVLVTHASNTALPVSNEVCTDLRDVAISIL